MIGKLKSIDAVETWLRSHAPQTPYVTIYHGFQINGKSTGSVAYRNETNADFDTVVERVKQFLDSNSEDGGRFTIFAKSSENKQDTNGRTGYIEIPPQYSRHGIGSVAPSVSNENIEARIAGAIARERASWEKDLQIQKLQERIGELENQEPEGYDWQGALTGLLEMLVQKIPESSIGKVVEHLFSKAEGETVDKLANMGNMYMQMKMQENAMKQQKNNNTSNDDDEIEVL